MHDPILLVIIGSSKGVTPNERIFEHLGAGYIAAYLRQAGHQVRIIDQNLMQLTLDQLINQVITHQPKLVGIACYQDGYLPLQRLVKAVKQELPTTHISMGGVFATNSYPLISRELPELDSVVLGDGEETFTMLADALTSQRDWTALPHLTYPGDPKQADKRPKYDTDLNQLPHPARDTLPLVLERDLFPIISASRGCYGNCTYCSITIQNRRRRVREMSQVVDELEWLNTEYRTRYFYFIDDTFVGRTTEDRRRIQEFVTELSNRGLDIQFSIECRANEVHPDVMAMLKDAGLFTVFLGVESGYQPTLDLFKKGVQVEQNLQAIQILTELGIRYQIGFIMFHPYTTLEEVAANLEFLQHVEQKNFLDSLHRRLMVFDNAPIGKLLEKDGIQCMPWSDTHVPFIHPEIDPLYRFIESFTAEIKPGINQLAVQYSQLTDPAQQEQVAQLHGTLCSTYVNTIYEYTQDPSTEMLDETLTHLLDTYRSAVDDLPFTIS